MQRSGRFPCSLCCLVGGNTKLRRPQTALSIMTLALICLWCKAAFNTGQTVCCVDMSTVSNTRPGCIPEARGSDSTSNRNLPQDPWRRRIASHHSTDSASAQCSARQTEGNSRVKRTASEKRATISSSSKLITPQLCQASQGLLPTKYLRASTTTTITCPRVLLTGSAGELAPSSWGQEERKPSTLSIQLTLSL